MRATWVLTVASLRYRAAALSALLSPRATNFNTSPSRAVKLATALCDSGAAMACRANRSTSRRVIEGASKYSALVAEP
jgi:hypothetical protein